MRKDDDMSSSKKIMLCPLEEKDSPILFNWINLREDVVFNNPYKPVHEHQHKKWFESITCRSDVIIFAIRKIVDQKLIGTCQLNSINYIARSAELQIRIGASEERGQGFGTEATDLLLFFAFNDLNLNRVSLTVYAGNERAVKTYQKTGFKEEGLLRQADFVDGKYVDLIVMSILKNEYNG